MTGRREPLTHVRVDWPQCRARGLCSELLPELIGLDDWGYPLVLDAVPPELEVRAREAVRACPQLALRLTRSDPG